MINHNDYFYKGYDISNKNKLERLAMEYSNPYGYNLASTSRRIVNLDQKCKRPNEDFVKNKEFNPKKV